MQHEAESKVRCHCPSPAVVNTGQVYQPALTGTSAADVPSFPQPAQKSGLGAGWARSCACGATGAAAGGAEAAHGAPHSLHQQQPHRPHRGAAGEPHGGDAPDRPPAKSEQLLFSVVLHEQDSPVEHKMQWHHSSHASAASVSADDACQAAGSNHAPERASRQLFCQPMQTPW